MTIQRAATLAAIGVLLRGLHYWVANMIPSWNSSGSMEQVTLVMVAIVDPAVWAYYFLSRSRIAAVLAAVLGLIEIGFSGYRQWELLSLESLDTVAFILGAVLPVVFWTFYLLLKWRFGLWYLLLFGLSQVALSVYGISNSAALIQQFWRDEPWQLLVAPLIWVVYWVTQTLFVRAAQKA